MLPYPQTFDKGKLSKDLLKEVPGLDKRDGGHEIPRVLSARAQKQHQSVQQAPPTRLHKDLTLLNVSKKDLDYHLIVLLSS